MAPACVCGDVMNPEGACANTAVCLALFDVVLDGLGKRLCVLCDGGTSVLPVISAACSKFNRYLKDTSVTHCTCVSVDAIDSVPALCGGFCVVSG